MYITNMELIKQKLTAEGRLSTSDIIKQILKDEDANPAKRYMAVGKQYYDGAHDILQHDFGSRGFMTRSRQQQGLTARDISSRTRTIPTTIMSTTSISSRWIRKLHTSSGSRPQRHGGGRGRSFRVEVL